MDLGQEYANRVEQQVRQFARPNDLKKLPLIYEYWMENYVRPKFKLVTGCSNVLQFYVENFLASISTPGVGVVASLGAGDCIIEEALARNFLKRGINNFKILCLELSAERLRRAHERLIGSDVLPYLELQVADLNKWSPPNYLDGVLAHHSLHHIVELESLFEGIVKKLKPTGVFVSADMIGRNGHMRWPEIEAVISRLWKIMPDRYKMQHQLNKFHHEFVNWDCSKTGFEGIRSQDILPLLKESFEFSTFFGYGGMPDVFVERGYGHNLDTNCKFDLDFLDFIEYLNELLIDFGVIKPTIMISCMKVKAGETLHTRCYKHWTPEFSTRYT